MPGSYVLMVEAADSRSNNSGAEPYRIDFEVKSDLSINVSDPYPNPSVLDVTFNVALGGSELPSEFTLSLMDVNGKLIRMFAKPDLDDFHTGINYLTWNGTDTNGTRVPAGVYVYKIQLSMQGQHVTKNGKIVLLR
jgi:flagellar hook assembly protein FlgD